MARGKSGAWMRRHVNDPYVREATRQGYRSRAAFKLMEIDRRDRILGPGLTVLDLGAAPGGWSQVAVERVGAAGRVVAVDLLPMAPLSRVAFVQGDVRQSGVLEQLRALLPPEGADVVLCDMAPNLSGIAATDAARADELVGVALEAAARMLKPKGTLLVKVFHGMGFEALLERARADFREVLVRKPQASRTSSSETYLLCRGLRQAAASFRR